MIFARVKDFKFHKICQIPNFHKNHQILSKKFLISQILWVLGRNMGTRSPNWWLLCTRSFPLCENSKKMTIVLKIGNNVEKEIRKIVADCFQILGQIGAFLFFALRHFAVLRIFRYKIWRLEPILSEPY